jgi:steroid 5-alpha reductase family enzyme
VSGLWAWSRHPNFAAEQTIWVVLYQWACYSTDTFMNWTFAGAFSYLLLFQGSTWLTELITAQKYPEYKEYQSLVGKFLPKMLPNNNTPEEKTKVIGKKKQ